MHSTDNGRRVRTTRRSLQVIDVVQQLGSARLTEIANEADMAISTVHKHVKTLEEAGLLTADGGEYKLGLRFINLGEDVKAYRDGFETAKAKVKEIAEETGEEVAFEVEDRGRLLAIYGAYSSPSNNRRGGTYHYMHTTASGKAILAHLPESRRDAIVERWGLPAETEHTITDRDELQMELEKIRRRGIAVNDEEFLEGLRALAAPILTRDGVFGAIDISGPKYRLKGEVLHDELADVVTEACREIESELEETI